MPTNFDVIIVGSGPAGVSAAFPLVQAGLQVLMVDGGRETHFAPPSQPFLNSRANDDKQWKWMLGEDFHALKKMDAVSPKLRVPIYRYVFEDFTAANAINPNNFIAIGSLAKGGLSNAWGCGVARLSADELAGFPFPEAELINAYERVTRRMGVSGANNDDLSDYFGLDAWCQPPLPMDALHHSLFKRYNARKSPLPGFRLGRSRVAALSQDHSGRRACDLSGNCLWGCHRRALYSSLDEISVLTQHENFHYRSGFIVDRISDSTELMSIHGRYRQNSETVMCKKIVLAAGTLATTRLALRALKLKLRVPLQSCPTAAFLLWLPTMTGLAKTNGFGLGQLSFSLQTTGDISAFGSTFCTTGIPVSEFVRHLPLGRRYGIDVLRHLLSSCLVGNVFLPGHLSNTMAALDDNGALNIDGGYSDRARELLADAARKLRRAYWQLGALLLPMSFTIGRPGGDIHYASTLPMRLNPSLGETDRNGELAGLPGISIVDGACLSSLSEKSHTLTIMANADRIGRILAHRIKAH